MLYVQEEYLCHCIDKIGSQNMQILFWLSFLFKKIILSNAYCRKNYKIEVSMEKIKSSIYPKSGLFFFLRI